MHYNFKSTSTCTFRSRTVLVTKSNQLSSLPGPGSYEIKKAFAKPPTLSPTKSERNLFKPIELLPGPGHYQTKSHIMDGPKKSLSYRFKQTFNKNPSPGAYENETEKILRNTAPSFSLGNKSKSMNDIIKHHNSYKLAPTAYTTATTFIKQHGTFIGSSKRKDLTQTEKTPAPNSYEIENADVYVSKSFGKCVIGGEKQRVSFITSNQKTPGPNTYNQNSFVEFNATHSKGFSCRQKLNNLISKEIAKVPGPGRYETSLMNKSTAPLYSAPQSQRLTFIDENKKSIKELPGPGQHDPKLRGTKYQSEKHFHFGRDKRKSLDEQQITPGPTAYHNHTMNLHQSAPKYSAAKNLQKNEFLSINPENPGPGQYNPKFNLVEQKLRINQVPRQQRPSFDKHKQTPGPGFYNLRGKEEGPEWRFASDKRLSFTELPNEAKGGVHYQIDSKVVDPPKYMKVTSKVDFYKEKPNAKRT